MNEGKFCVNGTCVETKGKSAAAVAGTIAIGAACMWALLSLLERNAAPTKR